MPGPTNRLLIEAPEAAAFARDAAAAGAGHDWPTQSQLGDLCLPAARGNSGQFRRRTLRPWCAAL